MIAARRFVTDQARGLRWWAVGVSALVLSATALYPSVEGNESFEQLAEGLPQVVTSAFGIDASIGLTSAPGYLHARLFSTLLPVVLLIFGIGIGTRTIAGAEEDGTLELTLAQPITRHRLALERYSSAVALVALLAGLGAAVLLVSAAVVGALDAVSLPGLLVACAGACALAVLHTSIAFAVGATSGRRAVASGTATTVAVAGYLLHGLLGVTDALRPLRFATPWHWYLGQNMLASGPAIGAVLIPLAASVALVAVSIPRFVARDLR